jgi:hypothetical protein
MITNLDIKYIECSELSKIIKLIPTHDDFYNLIKKLILNERIT